MKRILILMNGVAATFVILTIVCIIVWFILPYILMGLDYVFPHYNHNIAILPHDVEVKIPFEDNTQQTLILPKGLMLFSPCRHDFDRTSLDESSMYKIYIRLDAETLKSIIKDTDASYAEKIRELRRIGELETKLDVNMGQQSQSESRAEFFGVPIEIDDVREQEGGKDEFDKTTGCIRNSLPAPWL